LLKNQSIKSKFKSFNCFHTSGETAGLSSEIVEEAITPFEFQKLIGYDALKSGSHQSTWSQSL
jgi:hypothetical protein